MFQILFEHKSNNRSLKLVESPIKHMDETGHKGKHSSLKINLEINNYLIQ